PEPQCRLRPHFGHVEFSRRPSRAVSRATAPEAFGVARVDCVACTSQKQKTPPNGEVKSSRPTFPYRWRSRGRSHQPLQAVIQGNSIPSRILIDVHCNKHALAGNTRRQRRQAEERTMSAIRSSANECERVSIDFVHRTTPPREPGTGPALPRQSPPAKCRCLSISP